MRTPAISLALGLAVIGVLLPAAGLAKAPVLRSNSTFSNCDLPCSGVDTVGIFTDAKHADYGVFTSCTGYLDNDKSLKIRKSGSFSASHTIPYNLVVPSGALVQETATITISGKVKSATKIKGTASVTRPTCSVQFPFTAKRIGKN